MNDTTWSWTSWMPCHWGTAFHNWRKSLSPNYPEQITPRTTFNIAGTIFDVRKSTTKGWYEALLLDAQTPIKRQASWEEEIHLDQSTEVDWQERYSAPYKVSCETKLQSFAFKLAHRLIPCRHFLHKMRIRESEECVVCMERDTILHFFYECGRVQRFWQ